MTREIKFRAWYDSWPMQNMLFVGDDYGTKHPLDCCAYYKEGQPVKLMQYTGLKDKNGVEIYEGDIVETTYVSGTMNRSKYPPRAIIYDQELCEFNVSDTGDESLHKVIGNIHENPELVK